MARSIAHVRHIRLCRRALRMRSTCLVLPRRIDRIFLSLFVTVVAVFLPIMHSIFTSFSSSHSRVFFYSLALTLHPISVIHDPAHMPYLMIFSAFSQSMKGWWVSPRCGL